MKYFNKVLRRFVSMKFMLVIAIIDFYFVIANSEHWITIALTSLIIISYIASHLLLDVAIRCLEKMTIRLNEKDTKTEKLSIPTIPVRFFGGPLAGSEEKVDKLKPYLYHAHIPTDEEGRQIVGYTQIPGGGEMILYEAVYAKYEAVGDDGTYFFKGDVDRTEVMSDLQDDKENQGDDKLAQ